MYAIICTGGKQYRVQKNDEIIVERLAGAAGAKVVFDNVLMLGESGKATTNGTPHVAGASVKGEIIAQSKADKIKVVKFHRRKRYQRMHGHRQAQTHLKITDIALKGASKSTSKPAAKAQGNPKTRTAKE